MTWTLTAPQNRTFLWDPRSFLNRVNDRLQKMLDRFPEDALQDIDKRSMIWWMLMSSTLEASVFMWKNYSEILLSVKNTGKILTKKQMFKISEMLKMEQSDEIFGVSQISWENSPWKQLSLVNDEEVMSLSHAKVYVFSDSVLGLGKVNQNPASNTVWEQQLDWFKDSSQYRTLDTIDGEPMEFEWNIFPRFTTLQLVQEVQKFMKNGRTRTIPRTNYLHADVQWHHKGELQTMKRDVLLIPHLCLDISKMISSKTLVIPRTWIRNKVLFYSQRKTTRRMGQSRWIDDDQIRRKRTPSFPSHEPIVSRNAQKQRRW